MRQSAAGGRAGVQVAQKLRDVNDMQAMRVAVFEVMQLKGVDISAKPYGEPAAAVFDCQAMRPAAIAPVCRSGALARWNVSRDVKGVYREPRAIRPLTAGQTGRHAEAFGSPLACHFNRHYRFNRPGCQGGV